MVFHMVAKIIKYASLPALLIAAIFSCLAARYELLLDVAICLGALIAVQRAVRVREYFWAAGFVAIAVIFSPLLLVTKIFLLMGLSCVATLATLFAAWKAQPLPSV